MHALISHDFPDIMCQNYEHRFKLFWVVKRKPWRHFLRHRVISFCVIRI